MRYFLGNNCFNYYSSIIQLKKLADYKKIVHFTAINGKARIHNYVAMSCTHQPLSKTISQKLLIITAWLQHSNQTISLITNKKG